MTNLQDSYRARLKLLAHIKAVEGENNLYENHCAEFEAMILELRQQNETLREAVEAAPHDSGCAKVISGNKFEPGPWQCNCWKAQALKDTKE